MSISTHVLDATTGRPAAGLELALSRRDGDRWQELTRGRAHRRRPRCGPWHLPDHFPDRGLPEGPVPGGGDVLPGGRGDLPDHRPGRAPSRAPAAQPVRLLDLPWLLTAAADTGRQ